MPQTAKRARRRCYTLCTASAGVRFPKRRGLTFRFDFHLSLRGSGSGRRFAPFSLKCRRNRHGFSRFFLGVGDAADFTAADGDYSASRQRKSASCARASFPPATLGFRFFYFDVNAEKCRAEKRFASRKSFTPDGSHILEIRPGFKRCFSEKRPS